MMSKAEVLEWVNALPDDAEIGVDEGGLCLTTPDGKDWCEVGGVPLCDGCGIARNDCCCEEGV